MAKRKRKEPVVRDLEFSGYKFQSSPQGTVVQRESIDLSRQGDYGADPLGDGTFRMVPSGDVVDLEERNRRLARPRPNSKIVASSKDRYRATAAEKRQYGGSTVTEFYIFRKEDERDPSKWKIVRGYGATPGERKTDAIRRSGLLEEPAPTPSGTPNMRQRMYYVYTSQIAKTPKYQQFARTSSEAIERAAVIAEEDGESSDTTHWHAETEESMPNHEHGEALTLDQKREELVEEVENWIEQDRYALPNAFFLRIAHDAGVGLTDHEAVFEGEVYDLEDDEDREEVGHELVEQVRNASTGQVDGYYAHRTQLIEEDVGPSDEGDDEDEDEDDDE